MFIYLHFSPLCGMFLIFSLFIILPVLACNNSSCSHPLSSQNVTANPLFDIHFVFFSLFPYFCLSPLCPVSLLFLSMPPTAPTTLFLLLLPPSPPSLQSLSSPQTPTLSCVESLCCYQHGQSGCSRLASLLEQVTGAGGSHCHASSRSNRWGG